MDLLDALINLFEAFSLALFAFLLYNKENNYTSSLFITFISLFFVLVTYNFNYYMSLNLFNFLITLLSFIYITILNRENILVNILVASLPSIILLIIKFPFKTIIKAMYISIFDTNINLLFLSLLDKILLYIMIILLVRLLKYIRAFNKSLTWYCILSLWCIVTLYYTVIERYIFENTSTLNMFYFENLLVFLVIFSVIMIFKHSKSEQKRIIEQQLLITELNDKEEQYKDINNRMNEVSELKHDLKHILHSISSCLEENNIYQAKNILDNQIKNIYSIDKYISTGNNDLDYILNKSYALLQKQEIELSVSDFSAAIPVDKVDFFIFMGNLIDNAIENCEDNPSKKIMITNGILGGYYFIKIQNTILHSVLKTNPHLETTKSNKSIHGIGIKSTYQLLDKYDAKLEFSEDSMYFCAKIIIPLNDN